LAVWISFKILTVILIFIRIGSPDMEADQLFQVRSCLNQLIGYTHLYLVHADSNCGGKSARCINQEKSAKIEAAIRHWLPPAVSLIVAPERAAIVTSCIYDAEDHSRVGNRESLMKLL
jgi:hypothetical protein